MKCKTVNQKAFLSAVMVEILVIALVVLALSQKTVKLSGGPTDDFLAARYDFSAFYADNPTAHPVPFLASDIVVISSLYFWADHYAGEVKVVARERMGDFSFRGILPPVSALETFGSAVKFGYQTDGMGIWSGVRPFAEFVLTSQGLFYGWGIYGSQVPLVVSIPLPPDYSFVVHTYTIEVTPAALNWLIDAKVVASVSLASTGFQSFNMDWQGFLANLMLGHDSWTTFVQAITVNARYS